MVKYGSTLSTFDGSWDLSIGPLSAMAVRIPMLTWMRRFFLAMVLIYMGLLAAQRYSRCFADLVLRYAAWTPQLALVQFSGWLPTLSATVTRTTHNHHNTHDHRNIPLTTNRPDLAHRLVRGT